MPVRFFALLLLIALQLAACTAPAPPPATDAEASPEAVSLLGEPLYAASFSPEQRAALEADLAAARTAYEADSADVDNIIWLGRRLAYLWRYRDAVVVYTRGLDRYPDEPRLYRHRGHRYLSLRRLDAAVADLERAADLIEGTQDEVEPDGQPNAAGIPTSTLHTNIWYHLGLAYYLRGEFENALTAYRKCLAAAANDDMRVATLDWLYMTLRRLGRHDEAQALLAPIHADMELLENFAYHRRLLMYKGELTPDDLLRTDGPEEDRALDLATQGYGVGNWLLVEGDTTLALDIFRQVVAGSYWPAFGYLAAEADLQRLEK